MGRPDSANNAQIAQSQIFVNSRFQGGYRSIVDTATGVGPAFLLTSSIGISISSSPQPRGYSLQTSSHVEVNAAAVPGINLDYDKGSVGTSFKVGGDIGAAFNMTYGDIHQEQWATPALIGNGPGC